MTRKEMNVAARNRARQIASALLAAINQSIPVWEAFGIAGERMQIQHMQWNQLEDAFDKLQNDSSEANLKEYEVIEEAYEKSRDYNTLSETGEAQSPFLKALDFADYIATDIRLYNVCRAKDSEGKTCGLAYLGKLETSTRGSLAFLLHHGLEQARRSSSTFRQRESTSSRDRFDV